jgi:hypothetical protein
MGEVVQVEERKEDHSKELDGEGSEGRWEKGESLGVVIV